jgi:hypothetical protein
MITTTRRVAGLQIIATPCPACGSAMYKMICRCTMRKQGWNLCAKCVRCGETIGLTKRKGRK